MLLLQLFELTFVVALLGCQILQVEGKEILCLLCFLYLLVQAHFHLLVLISGSNFELL